MKKWIRIFLVCFVLVGGTAVFAHQLLNQFNKALDSLSASSFADVKMRPIPFSERVNKEQILASTSTPETISTSATSTDLKFSFVFPKKDSEVYIGCTYELSFESSTTTRLLETALIGVGTKEAVEPIKSGLAVESKIEPSTQSLDWKVGAVSLGEYYIQVSNINGVDLEQHSKVFTISKMPKGIGVNEKEKICKGSGGSL